MLSHFRSRVDDQNAMTWEEARVRVVFLTTWIVTYDTVRTGIGKWANGCEEADGDSRDGQACASIGYGQRAGDRSQSQAVSCIMRCRVMPRP